MTDATLQLFSGDSAGVVKVWDRHANLFDWTLSTVVPARENLVGACWMVRCMTAAQGSPVSGLRLHPVNRQLLVHTRDNVIRMLDLRVMSYTHVRVHLHLTSHRRCFAMFDCCRRSGTRARRTTRLPSAPHSRHAAHLFCPVGHARRCCVHALTVSGSEDGSIFAWKTDTAAVTQRYDDTEASQPIHQVVFHPHDNILAACSFGAPSPVLLYYAGLCACAATCETDCRGARPSSKEAQAARAAGAQVCPSFAPMTGNAGQGGACESGAEPRRPHLPAAAGGAVGRVARDQVWWRCVSLQLIIAAACPWPFARSASTSPPPVLMRRQHRPSASPACR